MAILRPVAAAIVLLIVSAASVPAQETKYVTDMLTVTVRSGPSVENKVLANASSGEQVTVLKTQEDGWVYVRLDGDKEGWMIARYLQDEPTAARRLADLDPQTENLSAKMEELKAANEQLKAELEQTQRQLNQSETAFQDLKQESSDIIKLKSDYNKLKKDYQGQGRQLAEASAEAESLRFSGQLKWFMAGAAVLVVGWLMGWALGRRRKRWSSGLY